MSSQKGLSDRQQSLIVFVSAILLSVAAVAVPAGAPYWVALTLGILGAIGFALKEAAGSQAQKA